jgi:hypothetical protein
MWKWILCAACCLVIKTLAGQEFPIVITEIMGDPVPSVGLPAEEYVELTNVSKEEVHLSGWSLTNGRTRGRFGDSIFLGPGEILILCPANAVSVFSAFGRTLGLSPFPPISNTGDTLFLFNEKEELVVAAAYRPSLLDATKAAGGWALELVNSSAACRQVKNWKASIDTLGGSPGKTNSQEDEAQEFPPVDPVHAWCPDAQTIRLVFTDRVHRSVAEQTSYYVLDEGPEIEKAELLGPFHEEVRLHLESVIQQGKIYTLKVAAIPGCNEAVEAGAGFRELKVGLPDTSEKAVLVNELLPDPSSEGSDFVELYHNGKSPVPLEGWQIAGRNSAGNLSAARPLVPGQRFFYPGDYLVLTTDANWLKKQFHVKHPNSVVELPSLPSFPNERGSVVLVNRNGEVVEEVNYDAAWHHEMLRNRDNVSLERRNPSEPSQSASNWTSAAMHAGYGTPGSENSQSGIASDPDRVFIGSDIVSPDADGQDDVCEINYEFATSGNLIRISIFDRAGKLQRQLINNGICAQTGLFYWDGRNDNNQFLPNGLYIIVADTWQLAGKTKRYRMAVTLGKKL